jgi:hypothetical protein
MNAQLQNLRGLLDTGERILANPIACALGFGQIDCGSYACFIGWHVRYNGNEDGLLRAYYNGNLGFDIDTVKKHFAITMREFDQIFGAVIDINDEYGAELDPRADHPGPEAYVELRRRLAFLRELIAKREAELGVEAQRSAA